jgi:protein dithiol oxidoreductase (disulfide-forming)
MYAKLLGLALMFATATSAFAQQAFIEGKDYFRLKAAQPVQVAKDKVEVLELFQYACIHCASMEAPLAVWKKTMPAATGFRRMHVTFGNKQLESLARTHMAIEAMGIVDTAHGAMFKEVQQGKTPTTDLNLIAQRFTTMGLDGKKFLATANSFSVTQKIKQNDAILPRYEAGGTPEFIVAGKYRASVLAGMPQERTLQVVSFLIQKELIERAAAAKPR